MIVKRQFTPAAMWPYVRFDLSLAVVASVTAWLLVARAGLVQVALPVTLAVVLGTALSILLAVRVNTAYQRWWEASTTWAQLVGFSRTLVRVVVAVTSAKPDADPAAIARFRRDVARRQVAYLIALRLQLRGQLDTTEGRFELADRLTEEEAADLSEADNPATLLLARQSQRIIAAFGEGVLSGFDNFQMEFSLAGASLQQALAERTAMQPMLRTYDVFTRYLLLVDRDLLATLGEPERPATPGPVEGYLW